jgi:hypothetical protein
MVMGWERRTCAAAALVLGCAVGAARGQADDKVYPLHGVVVNGLTGKPVAGALVRSADGRMATMTDGEGRFRVELRVPAGAPGVGSGPSGDGGYLDLQVEKPGYLAERELGSIAIDGTLANTEVKRVLMPAGRIAGEVSASGVDAAAGVTVQLLLRSVGADGRYHWRAGQSSVTNGRGEFHFSNLRPGYYSLTAMQWNGEEMLEPQRDAVRKQYPAVFLGGGATQEGATKVHLGYGDSAREELHLELKTFYPVTIPMPVAGSRVSVRSLEMDAWDPYGLQYVARDKAIEGWLPDGTYGLMISSFGEQSTSAMVNVNVADAPVRTKPVALGPGGRIEVRVHDERTKPEPPQPEPSADPEAIRESQRERSMPPVQMFLTQENGSAPLLMSSSEEITGVGPGRYFVTTMASRGYVAAMSSGASDLLRNVLVVGPGGGAAPIEITLRDDTASAAGTLTGGSGALPQKSTVFFFPTDTRGLFKEGEVARDGTYSMKDLAPGSYRVFALAGVRWMLPYRDADAMQPVQSQGVAVTVAPNQAVELDVPLIQAAVPEEWGLDDDYVEL